MTKEEYNMICFNLDKKYKELNSISADIFTLNTTINTLAEEIKELEEKKKEYTEDN